jgi:hypothetical protein
MWVGGTPARRIVALGRGGGLVLSGLTLGYATNVSVGAVTLGAIGEAFIAPGGTSQPNDPLATIRVYVEDVLGLLKSTLVEQRTGRFSVFGIRERR